MVAAIASLPIRTVAATASLLMRTVAATASLPSLILATTALWLRAPGPSLIAVTIAERTGFTLNDLPTSFERRVVNPSAASDCLPTCLVRLLTWPDPATRSLAGNLLIEAETPTEAASVRNLILKAVRAGFKLAPVVLTILTWRARVADRLPVRFITLETCFDRVAAGDRVATSVKSLTFRFEILADRVSVADFVTLGCFDTTGELPNVAVRADCWTALDRPRARASVALASFPTCLDTTEDVLRVAERARL